MKIFTSLFQLQIWHKMKHNENFKQWFNVFVIISETLQGHECKFYEIWFTYLSFIVLLFMFLSGPLNIHCEVAQLMMIPVVNSLTNTLFP